MYWSQSKCTYSTCDPLAEDKCPIDLIFIITDSLLCSETREDSLVSTFPTLDFTETEVEEQIFTTYIKLHKTILTALHN